MTAGGGRWLGMVLAGTLAFATSDNVLAQGAASDPTPVTTESTPELPTKPNYAAPVAGIVTFEFLLNRYAERSVDRATYDVSVSSVRRNLRSKWVVDNDPFSTNQFLHPYQGSIYHGFARSAGLNYWQSMAYTIGGSALWEIAGETTPPSINDQIASGFGGSFLGEPLFRIASLVLERNHLPAFWRELLTMTISPSTEFDRAVYGNRFRNVFSSRDASIFHRIDIGGMGTASVTKGLLQSLIRNEGTADLSIDYGLPSRANYSYTRPFDYFSFELGASTANAFEHIFSRGLLAGRSYGDGATGTRGVWGLFGSYDYVAPQIFRVSSVAVSLGDTTTQRLFGPLELQTTLLGGVGYGAAGTIHGAGEQDYHYGLTPQALAAARLISWERQAIDVTVRDFYVSRVASSNRRGSENNIRVDGLLTFRLIGHNGASVKYIWSRRAAEYPDLGSRLQSRGTFGIFYTYLGDPHFGTISR